MRRKERRKICESIKSECSKSINYLKFVLKYLMFYKTQKSIYFWVVLGNAHADNFCSQFQSRYNDTRGPPFFSTKKKKKKKPPHCAHNAHTEKRPHKAAFKSFSASPFFSASLSLSPPPPPPSLFSTHNLIAKDLGQRGGSLIGFV